MKCPRCQSDNPDASRFCGSCAAPLKAEVQAGLSATKTLVAPTLGLAKGAMVAGKYRILEEIGRGGMGIVYKAEDTKLGRTVALKFLPPQLTQDSEARDRFIQEARAASALDHPNVCTIYEIGETEDGRMFIAMGCYEGESLRDKIKKGPVEKQEALGLALQVAQGMAKAHEKGIIHRDLKPGNILITKDGVAKIVDFGLAKLAGQVRITKEGTLLGTVAYMSPEQAIGEAVDQRTDIWSLGIVLYEMLTGVLPFKGDYDQSLIHSILSAEPEPMGKIKKGLPKGLEAIVLKALAKNPNHRYQSMGEMSEDLESVAEGLKPRIAKSRLLRGKVLGVRKSYAYGVLVALAAVSALTIAFNPGGLRDRFFGQTGAGATISLAVLPLKNFSGDPAQEVFADGLTDQLIAKLGRIKAISIRSCTSAMQYKNTKKSLPQIARELGVKRIVEASLERSGDKVSMNPRLIDARHDRILWQQKYEGGVKEIEALQSEVVQAVARELGVEVTPQESQRLKAKAYVDPIVFDTVLKATDIIESASREEEVRQALDLFQKAVERDPTYAKAWAGLGDSLWYLGCSGYEYVAPGEVRDKAIAAVDRALELDPNSAEAHKARASIAYDGEWDIAKAQRHLDIALELRPGYAAAHGMYSLVLETWLHRLDEARFHIDRFNELEPVEGLETAFWWQTQGRPEKALQEAGRLSRRYPGAWPFRWQMGYSQLVLGQPRQAVAEFEEAIKLHDDRSGGVLAPLGLAYGLAGRTADALNILTEMEQLAQKSYVSPFLFAEVYSGLGRMDEAFRMLDRALEERTPALVFCTPFNGHIVALKRDPRWKSFLARLRPLVKLPPGTPDPFS